MRYSIIIPHYNTPALLREAIASVPTRADVELCVVEDAAHRGAGWARNQALAAATGEWLLFVDADDLLMHNALAVLDEAVEQYAQSEVDVIYFRMCSTYADTGEPSNREAHVNRLVDAWLAEPTRKHELALRYHHHEPSAKLIRRAMVEQYGIRFEEVRWANDVRFSTMVGHYARAIAAVPEVVYDLRVVRGSLVNQHTLESRRCRYEVMLRNNALLREWGYPQMQESLMYSLRRAYRLGGWRALWAFVRIGRAHGAQFTIGWQNWLRNFFNKEEETGKAQYITH